MVEKACLHIEKVNTHFDGSINALHRAFLTAEAGDNDVYTLKKMLQQDDKNDFFQAMVKEINDHTEKKHWDLVHRSDMPPGTKIILAVWAFKRKRYPDGRILKHRARLNAHG